ncbi:hypothetical protein NHX12_011848 [Muraenolepis orangiensis]|uniref:Bardet-Biedl syndrome 12 n=1 Tax=Muraenolepis orangiensis TaxID=630683 RepID=A0A9Q0DH12_9TELE|nr:hypothetical protein NHX12_011848 [Muraenolepis orangiensis]
MRSSGVMNLEQHVGLQKVSALAGLTLSSLGPCKAYKFIQEEEEEGGRSSGRAALVCSCLRLLESVQPSCAVGQLVSEAVRAHHAACGSGAGCLLFLAGAWSRAALECLRRGMAPLRVVGAMREGLDVCLQACRTHRVRLDTATEPRSPALSTEEDAARRTREHPRKGRGKVKLTHSRYFCGAAPDPASLVTPPSPPDVGPTARALSHGHDRSMELVLRVARLQAVLDVGKVVTCVVPGVSEERACVSPGWVVRLPPEKVAVTRLLSGRSLRVALIAGDLCRRYRHPGFKTPQGLSHVTDRLDPGGSGEEGRWTDGVLTSLLRLGVDLLLVSGATDDSLSLRCLVHGILPVDRVRASVLQAFAEATGATAVTYAAQLSQRCVGAGAKVTPWRDLGERRAVIISSEAGGGLATVVLTGCVPAKLQSMEDEFWACAHRLHGALRDGAVLPGAGLIEVVCVRDLRKHARRPLKLPGEAEPEAGGLYRAEVLRLMADGLMDYVATVMANSGRCSKLEAWTEVSQKVERLDGLSGVLEDEKGPAVTSGDGAEGTVYDNLSVKVEAWTRAMDLVFLVLQTDAEIITGVDPETLRTQTDLMLL